MIEVEVKFAVPESLDLRAVLHSRFGLASGSCCEESDEYFQHPCRDFDVTDEALRIRRSDQAVTFTWKGPRLDLLTKSREEREITFESAEASEQEAGLRAILMALGFTSAGRVHKRRELFSVPWQEQTVTLSFDQVTGLSPFVELEIVCEDSQRAAATSALLDLAASLNLNQSERRSYLELVLEQAPAKDNDSTP
jgi:adenylate cyclase class 2